MKLIELQNNTFSAKQKTYFDGIFTDADLKNHIKVSNANDVKIIDASGDNFKLIKNILNARSGIPMDTHVLAAKVKLVGNINGILITGGKESGHKVVINKSDFSNLDRFAAREDNQTVFGKLISKYNEAVIKAGEIGKYFDDDDTEVIGYITDLLSNTISSNDIKVFFNILNIVTNNRTKTLVMSDEDFRGKTDGTPFEIKLKGGEYITGFYKVGELVFGSGSAAQTAVLAKFIAK